MSADKVRAELLRLELKGGLALVLRDPKVARDVAGDPGNATGSVFPTDTIPKAPVLALGGADLAEEGVGFGLPVLRGRFDTVFPGSFRFRRRGGPASFELEFEMNLVERLSRRGEPKPRDRPDGGAVNLVKEFFAYLHRALPFTRRAITSLSNLLRTALGMRTVFTRATSLGRVRVEYRVDGATGVISIRADAGDARVDETQRLILMNEAGARSFDLYEDSDGARLSGRDIESWRKVEAERAVFRDRRSGAWFSARARPGVRLFRGRELVGDRLSWSGLAFILPPGAKEFEYEIEAGVSL